MEGEPFHIFRHIEGNCQGEERRSRERGKKRKGDERRRKQEERRGGLKKRVGLYYLQ